MEADVTHGKRIIRYRVVSSLFSHLGLCPENFVRSPVVDFCFVPADEICIIFVSFDTTSPVLRIINIGALDR